MTRADWNADRAEEAADISLGSAQVAQKAASKVMDALPVPDPARQRELPAADRRGGRLVRAGGRSLGACVTAGNAHAGVSSASSADDGFSTGWR